MNTNWHDYSVSQHGDNSSSEHVPKINLLPFEVDTSQVRYMPAEKRQAQNTRPLGSTSTTSSSEYTKYSAKEPGTLSEPGSPRSRHWQKHIQNPAPVYSGNRFTSDMDTHHIQTDASFVEITPENPDNSLRLYLGADQRNEIDLHGRNSLEIQSESTLDQNTRSLETIGNNNQWDGNFSKPRGSNEDQMLKSSKSLDFAEVFKQQRKDSMATLMHSTSSSRRPSHVAHTRALNVNLMPPPPKTPPMPAFSRRGSIPSEFRRRGSTANAWGIKAAPPSMGKEQRMAFNRYNNTMDHREGSQQGRRSISRPASVKSTKNYKADLENWPVLSIPSGSSVGKSRSMRSFQSTINPFDKSEHSLTYTPGKAGQINHRYPDRKYQSRRKQRRSAGGCGGNCSICRLMFIIGVLMVIAAVIAIGVILGLKKKHTMGGTLTDTNATESGLTPVWRPAIGNTWQIQQGQITNLPTFRAQVHHIDLFDNNATLIASLHSLGRRVICSFSAGTVESWRSDAKNFEKNDLGSSFQNSSNQTWVDTRSQSVRSIMSARITSAKSKGCDGVDAMNIDGYSSGTSTGFPLSVDTASDYITYLSKTAHAADIGIGLHNAPDLISKSIGVVDWGLNEGCATDGTCAQYQAFILAGMPVFHIEYANNGTAAVLNMACSAQGVSGFSTLVKREILDSWSVQCPYGV